MKKLSISLQGQNALDQEMNTQPEIHIALMGLAAGYQPEKKMASKLLQLNYAYLTDEE